MAALQVLRDRFDRPLSEADVRRAFPETGEFFNSPEYVEFAAGG